MELSSSSLFRCGEERVEQAWRARDPYWQRAACADLDGVSMHIVEGGRDIY